MNDSGQEMTLAEYVGVLPAGHRAHGELSRLLRIEAAAKDAAVHIRPHLHRHITEVNLMAAVDR